MASPKYIRITFQSDTNMEYAEKVADVLRALAHVVDVEITETELEDSFAINNAKWSLRSEMAKILWPESSR
jgi:hypothetical protein